MSQTAIVILNWNGADFLNQFLPTVIEHSTGHDIIVADNASTDDSVSFIKNNYPEIQVISNLSNGGFAKGYNDALSQLKGKYDYYLLLNSDIEVTDNWLAPLISRLDDQPEIAGVQPKILSFHSRNHFEHAGAAGGMMDKNYYPFCRGRIFDSVEEDHGQYDYPTPVFWTSGACMLIRSTVFHQLDGFDESFFAHMEEIDLCWRAKNQGYSFYAVPTSVVYHVGGGTLNYESPRKTFLNFRNSLFMIHKNHEGWLFGKILYRLILDGIAGINYAVRFKFKHLGAILKAHFAYYNQLAALTKKRKTLKPLRNNPNTAGLFRGSLLFNYFLKGVKKYYLLDRKRFYSHK
jgi:GT2 family glycosyltransferase